MTVLIQKLQVIPSDCLAETVAESMGTAFKAIKRLEDEWISGVNRFYRNGEALFVT